MLAQRAILHFLSAMATSLAVGARLAVPFSVCAKEGGASPAPTGNMSRGLGQYDRRGPAGFGIVAGRIPIYYLFRRRASHLAVKQGSSWAGIVFNPGVTPFVRRR